MRSQNANQMVDSGQTKIKICGLYRDADIDVVNPARLCRFCILSTQSPLCDMGADERLSGKVAVRDPGSGCMCKLAGGGGGSAPEGRSYPDCSASWNGR